MLHDMNEKKKKKKYRKFYFNLSNLLLLLLFFGKCAHLPYISNLLYFIKNLMKYAIHPRVEGGRLREGI
jgi:hypothetical protein